MATPVVKPRLAWQPVLALLAVVAVFPFYERQLNNRAPLPSPLAAVAAPSGWLDASAPVTEWTPHWTGMDTQRVMHLAQGDDQVMLYLAWYGAQRQDAELINFANQFIPQEHETWRKTWETGRTVELNGKPVALRQAFLDSPKLGQKLLVWQWNRFHGESGTSVIRAKLLLAWLKTLGGNDAGTSVIIAAPYLERPEEAEAVLQRFATALDAGLNAVLDGAKR
jgi:EpsI family protein